jgi:hypothetical protein
LLRRFRIALWNNSTGKILAVGRLSDGHEDAETHGDHGKG